METSTDISLTLKQATDRRFKIIEDEKQHVALEHRAVLATADYKQESTLTAVSYPCKHAVLLASPLSRLCRLDGAFT